MRKNFRFLVIQILSLVAAKLSFAQNSDVHSNVINNNRNLLLSDRIGDGTGTCVARYDKAALQAVLKQMTEEQIKATFDSLKTPAEKESLLQLLEENQ